MKAAEIRAKKADELKDQLIALKKEQMNLRFQQVSGELQNTARFEQVRRDIARIQTVLNEQKNGAEAKKPAKAAKAKKASKKTAA